MSAMQLRPGDEGMVFDRRHLDHYTMHNQRLAAEVLGLFLAQLPATLQLLAEAGTADEWRHAAHALKGSCAAVGARRLHELALDLEKVSFPGEAELRLLRLQAVKAAAADFRRTVKGAYPEPAAS